MNINYCPNCGGPVRGNEIFCSRCGFNLYSFSPLKFKIDESTYLNQLLSYVVKIETNKGTGSGFVADSSGVVVTNYHVIEGATEIWVKFAQGVRCKVENIQAINPGIDYAVLNIIPPKGYEIKSALLGDSDTLHVGEKIIVIGNPLGDFEKTVSTGVISGIRPGDNLIQMTAPISPGSSGGPVFNEKGEVVGIAVSGVPLGQNINFFVPINLIKPALKKPVKFVWEKVLFKNICKCKIISGVFHPEEEKLYILTEEHRIRIFNFKGKEEEPIELRNGATNIFFPNNNELGIHFPGKILFCNLKKSEVRIHTIPIELEIPTSELTYNNKLYLLSDIRNNIFFLMIERISIQDFKVSMLFILPALSPFYEIAYPIKKLFLIGPMIGDTPYYAAITCNNGLVKIYRIKTDYVSYIGKICVTELTLIKEFEHARGAKITVSALSPDMSTLVIGTDKGKIKFSDFTDIRKKINFDVVFSLRSFSEITVLTFNNTGDYLLCGNASGDISIFKKIKGGEKDG